MRYRALDVNGDMTFGQGSRNFYQDIPAAVAQAVYTRLRLMTNEWWLDLREGTPYAEQILTAGGRLLADQALKSRILNTQGVTELLDYVSFIDNNRHMTVSGNLHTLYGEANFIMPLVAQVPPMPRPIDPPPRLPARPAGPALGGGVTWNVALNEVGTAVDTTTSISGITRRLDFSKNYNSQYLVVGVP